MIKEYLSTIKKSFITAALATLLVFAVVPTSVSASTGFEIALANGIVTAAEIPDGVEVTPTNRVIVASSAVNVFDTYGNVYCVAQPGIRVYEYATLSNGTSLIQYGVDGYAFTTTGSWYIEGTIPATTTNSDITKVAQEKTTRSGMYGRFTIPNAGIDVGLFSIDGDMRNIGSLGQTYCDNKDSAWYFAAYYSSATGYAWEGSDWVIADHSNQDFANLSKVSVGDKAYINNGSTITEYVCVSVSNAINNYNSGYFTDRGIGFYDYNGNTLASSDRGDLITYTCQQDYYHILFCLWEPVTT